MAQSYFKNFPTVQYGQHSLRNVVLKAAFAKELLNSVDSFYPYTVKGDESPTLVSFNYYGSIKYVWLIFLANDIVDPYYDWPLSQVAFNEFVAKKYGSIEAAAFISNAKYYRNPDYKYLMTATTYNNITVGERIGWSPISNYDYELEINENKRKIRLVDNAIANDISLELEKILKKVNL